MSDSTTGKAQIVVAIIGLVGALGAALFANWDKVFQPPETKSTVTSLAKHSEPTETEKSTPVNPLPVVSTRNPQQASNAENGPYHIVTQSTKSLQDAKSSADSLRKKGYPSEVILSSTGYYGVTLGHYSKGDARTVLLRAIQQGAAPNDAFVLPLDRYKETIYP